MFSKLLTASNIIRATSEDLPSQVNHVWTFMLLTSMGLVISLVQYVGDPIQCWCPANMPEVHCNYTKAMCWVKETYYVDIGENIPMNKELRRENEVTYYPWSPWVLFFMATMLKFPHAIWIGFAPLSDLNLDRLVEDADEEADVVELATVIRIWLWQNRLRRRGSCFRLKRILGAIGIFWLGRHRRTFLTGLVIFVKLCYLFTSVFLFYSLNVFIDEDFTSYGWDTMYDFIHGVATDSARFPKHTMCDIQIRQMNNVNTYSIQCLLPINLYNQKIFLFLWYWYVLLTITNAYSLVFWTFNLLSPARRWKFVNDYVIIMDHIEKNKKLVDVPAETEENGSGNNSEHQTETSRASSEAVNVSDDLVADDIIEEEEKFDEDSSLLSVGLNTDGTRLRVGKHVNFIDDPSGFRPRKKKRKRKRHLHLSSIETDQEEIRERVERREIFQKTVWMYRQFDYDGLVVFRTLESAVGVVLANDVFIELYCQLKAAEEHSRK